MSILWRPTDGFANRMSIFSAIAIAIAFDLDAHHGSAMLLVEQLIEKSSAVADRVFALTRGSVTLEASAKEPGLPVKLERMYFGRKDAPNIAQ